MFPFFSWSCPGNLLKMVMYSRFLEHFLAFQQFTMNIAPQESICSLTGFCCSVPVPLRYCNPEMDGWMSPSGRYRFLRACMENLDKGQSTKTNRRFLFIMGPL